MHTKSNIQLIRENLALREAFADNIKEFMERYTIEDSYFGIARGMSPHTIRESHTLNEYTRGYFVVEHEYTTIDEAISNMAPTQIVRIIENKRFQVGERFEKLSDTHGDNIIDISTGSPIS